MSAAGLSRGKMAADAPQPESFAFTPENAAQASAIIARYPQGRQQSAVMPLLMLAQKQNGNWLPKAAMDTVAFMLGMPPMRVYEVATFYTMYNLRPVGRYHVQLCTTTPCWLRGSDEIVKACEKHLGIHLGETTADGMFHVDEVECLGACVNAPMCQITSGTMDNFYEDLTADNVVQLLKDLSMNRTPKAGSLAGRQSSEPQGGATTLKNIKSAVAKSSAPAAPTAPAAEPISAETKAETVQEALPGIQPGGKKRYSKETEPKDKPKRAPRKKKETE